MSTRTVTRGRTRADHALALACATVKRYRPDGGTLDADDMFSAALEGAALALHRYDESRGVSFAGFAVTLIRYAMLDEARLWDPLTRMERRKVREGEDVPRVILSLDPILMDDDDAWMNQDALRDEGEDVEGEALARMDAALCRQLVAKLPPREREAVRARFWEGITHKEIGVRMGVTASRVDGLVQQGLGRLRKWAEAYGLAPEGWGAETQETSGGEPAEREAPGAGCKAEVTR